jgi:hypothetical protein
VPFRGCHAQSWPSCTRVVSGCGPREFQRIFRRYATVSGALIGLLFVAISVSPEKLSSQGENVEHQIKAAAAFSALINTMLVSLFALIPGNGFGEATSILSVVGLASTAGLIIFFLRNRRRDEPIRTGQILLVAGSLVLYTFKLINGAELWRSPHHASSVTTKRRF